MRNNVLHIYGQGAWHDDAYIVGDPDALQALEKAIQRARLENVSREDFFVSDGEGYRVFIKVVKESDMDIVPYTDECALGNDARWGCDHFTMADFKRR